MLDSSDIQSVVEARTSFSVRSPIHNRQQALLHCTNAVTASQPYRVPKPTQLPNYLTHARLEVSGIFPGVCYEAKS